MSQALQNQPANGSAPQGMGPRLADGTRSASTEIRSAVAAHVKRYGAAGAARALGVSRSVVLAVLAEQPVRPGSLALIRESLRRRIEAAGTPGPSMVAADITRGAF